MKRTIIFLLLITKISFGQCELCKLMSGTNGFKGQTPSKQLVSLESCILKIRNYNKNDSLLWGINLGLKKLNPFGEYLTPFNPQKGDYFGILSFWEQNEAYYESINLTEFWTDTTKEAGLAISANVNTKDNPKKASKIIKLLKKEIKLCQDPVTIEIRDISDTKNKNGVNLTFQNNKNTKELIVLIDDQEIENAKFKFIPLENGQHTIEILNKKERLQIRTILIEKGKTTKIIVNGA